MAASYVRVKCAIDTGAISRVDVRVVLKFNLVVATFAKTRFAAVNSVLAFDLVGILYEATIKLYKCFTLVRGACLTDYRAKHCQVFHMQN